MSNLTETVQDTRKLAGLKQLVLVEDAFAELRDKLNEFTGLYGLKALREKMVAIADELEAEAEAQAA